MALNVLTAPPASLAALSPVLSPSTRTSANALLAFVVQATPAQLTVPTPVYVLGLDSLTGTAGTAGAKLWGWRYLVDKGTGPKVAAETSYDAVHDQHAFSSLNEGPFVADTPIQVAAAERDPRIVAGDYELRLLRIPGLNVVALWLKDRLAGNDLFVPLSPAPAPLTAGTTYGAPDLAALLKAPAEARAKFDDRPKT